MNNVANKPVFGYCISALIVLAATVMPAFADVTIRPSSDWDGTKPCSGADDTERIRQALRMSRGTVRFESGKYQLSGPLPLESGRTYQGAGSWHPKYGSTLIQCTSNQPVFVINGHVDNVTIAGLTFDGSVKENSPDPHPQGISGIKAASGPNTKAVLANSVVRDNHFFYGIEEGIETPMVSTRIENNAFGGHGDSDHAAARRRHIHAVPTAGGNNNNWVSGNILTYALGGAESVLFEGGAQLHIIDNDIEDNNFITVCDSDRKNCHHVGAGNPETVLRISDMSDVIIQGNWFEQNGGAAQMIFEVGSKQLGNGRVRLEDNIYILDVLSEKKCVEKHYVLDVSYENCFVFLTSADLQVSPSGSAPPKRPSPQVYMGYEAGYVNGPLVTGPASFEECHLHIVGPFSGFYGSVEVAVQTTGNPACL
jgi:hypothetical protein